MLNYGIREWKKKKKIKIRIIKGKEGLGI